MKAITVEWFEIPVSDMERAMSFYERVFGIKLSHQKLGVLDMAWFPFNDASGGAGGTLVKHDDFYAPSTSGTLVYFSSENLAKELLRVESAGGRVLIPKTQISPEIGYMAVFIDSEGNRLALHSKK
ncbi:VOC family protein [Pararhodonellum marinum]|uniref:VOC family protein n=1 Tax=Pararhodonellum marinum TaxID=2755358 RepID=UPI001890297A|nr:VOC family protein [Pararhodonellum marinum]